MGSGRDPIDETLIVQGRRRTKPSNRLPQEIGRVPQSTAAADPSQTNLNNLPDADELDFYDSESDEVPLPKSH
ncbi:hypothetical protein D9757_013204 [Collybiopsis confluens]|uniref:Uncharacterized protein n=1 Tax=Collybiopsis confluens TaxID=2823264 RepID=A0A8H5G1L3_9AGAR|nr:hypothetical protein D9757_013204 [Collybiopsis confluens]